MWLGMGLTPKSSRANTLPRARHCSRRASRRTPEGTVLAMAVMSMGSRGTRGLVSGPRHEQRTHTDTASNKHRAVGGIQSALEGDRTTNSFVNSGP